MGRAVLQAERSCREARQSGPGPVACPGRGVIAPRREVKGGVLLPPGTEQAPVLCTALWSCAERWQPECLGLDLLTHPSGAQWEEASSSCPSEFGPSAQPASSAGWGQAGHPPAAPTSGGLMLCPWAGHSAHGALQPTLPRPGFSMAAQGPGPTCLGEVLVPPVLIQSRFRDRRVGFSPSPLGKAKGICPPWCKTFLL